MTDKVITVGKPPLWAFILSGVIVLILLWFLRPLFHGVVLQIFTNPAAFLFFIALGAGAVMAALDKKKLARVCFTIVALSFVVMAISIPLFHLSVVKNTEYSIIPTMYESDELRVVPLAVARRFGRDSLTISTQQSGDYDLISKEGKQYWVAPRIPSSFLLSLSRNVEGLVLVDAQQPSRVIELADQTFTVGEGLFITDNIFWRLAKEKYFAKVTEVFYVFDESVRDYKIVAPFLTYEWAFPRLRPTFGGVFIVEGNGKVTEVSANEIGQYDYLVNSRVYPEELARLVVESYQYKDGLLNKWFIHNDQIEVVDLPGQGNQQPFLLQTKDGLKWVIATEPFGQSFGVSKIFFIDAVTGKVELYNTGSALTGPVKVASYVRSEFPMIDWFQNTIVEPRPYIFNETLYWLMSITPSDYGGIAKTVLVSAKTNEVFSFDTHTELSSFISGESTTVSILSATDNETIDQKIISIERLLQEIKELSKKEE
ncbi:MAG: hypothetical protein ACI8Y7_000555 [Candidatus Woesearchaeota archaeon]|jgi:hypothetical protein